MNAEPEIDPKYAVPAVRRVFYAHRKSAADEDVNADRDILWGLLASRNPQVKVEVTAGRDDYKARAQRAGGPRPWAQSCAADVMGEPRFHVFVTTDLNVGAWTAMLLSGAIGAGRKVLWWGGKPDPGAVFKRIVGVQKTDGNSVDGWTLVEAP